MSNLSVSKEVIGEGQEAKQYIIVSASNEMISIEGEHLNYLKERKSDGKRGEFVYAQRNTFQGWDENLPGSFWFPSEEVELLMSIVEHVKLPAKHKLMPHLNQLPKEKQTIVLTQTHLLNGLRIGGIIEVIQ
jgi:hypothetical protein